MNPDDLASLARTPVVLREILIDRSDEWLDARHGTDVFSPRETLGHLIQGERELWIPRIKLILEAERPKTFGPFDIKSGDEISHTLSVEILVQTFADLRQASLDELQKLTITPEGLAKTGIHPKFGEVTLDQLLATWVAHDLYHLGQIFKSFSAPLQPRIGPWQEFLNLPHFN